MSEAVENPGSGAGSVVSVGVAALDARGRIVSATPPFGRLWGVLRGAELVGREGAALWRDVAPWEAAQAALRELGSWEGDLVARAVDGTERPVRVSLHALPGGGEGGAAQVVSCVDATACDRARRAVVQLEERLRILIEATPAGVAMLDKDMRYIACSRRWLSDYRVGDVSVKGRTHYEVFPEIPERWREVHRRALAGASQGCEHDEFERPDGTVQHIRWAIEPWPDPAGGVGGLILFSEDITARVMADRERGLAEERLREAQRIAHVGSWQFDHRSGELVWSDEIYRIIELDPAAVPPSYAAYLAKVHPDDRALVDEEYASSLVTRRPYRVLHRLALGGDRVRFVEVQCETTFYADGQPSITRGTAQDITARVLAEEDLRRSLAEKETLLREIHHRVKNNLQVVSSLLHFQAKKARSAEEIGALAELRQRIVAMTLVHERLYRARDLARIDLGEYLRALGAALQQGAGRSRVRVDVTADGVSLPIESALPCGMIVAELLTNVFKHAYPEGGEGVATVTVRHDGPRVVLECADDGVGYPEGFEARTATSFGWELVRTLARQVGGSVRVLAPPGARVRLEFGGEAEVLAE